MKAWTIKTPRSKALVYASNKRQAAAIYSEQHPGQQIKGISPNYHAQNMHPRPSSWSEFIARGGDR